MSVSNGQPADAPTLNAAFASKTVANTLVGVNSLANTSDPNSGATITNLQRAVNDLFDTTGMTGEGDATAKTYSSTTTVTNGDDRKVAIGKLDAQVGVNVSDITARVTLATVQTITGAKTFTTEATFQEDLKVEGLSQSLSNNVSATDVTELVYDKDNTETVIAWLTIARRDDAEGRRAVGKFVAHWENEASAWSVDFTQEAGDIGFGGVTFSFTDTAGVLQIKYATDDMAGGNYSGSIRTATIFQFGV